MGFRGYVRDSRHKTAANTLLGSAVLPFVIQTEVEGSRISGNFSTGQKICDFLQFGFVRLPEACAEVKESNNLHSGRNC
jgi:hypothetical protein